MIERISKGDAEAPEREEGDESLLNRLPLVPLSKSPHSFVKWAGGKTQLLVSLERYFPEQFSTYYEPFLGGGVVFFYLVSTRPPFAAVLSDINKELVVAYRVVKAKIDLIELLKIHEANYEQSPKDCYYYKVRMEGPLEEVEELLD